MGGGRVANGVGGERKSGPQPTNQPLRPCCATIWWRHSVERERERETDLSCGTSMPRERCHIGKALLSPVVPVQQIHGARRGWMRILPKRPTPRWIASVVRYVWLRFGSKVSYQWLPQSHNFKWTSRDLTIPLPH
jgi:hypothetical protein